MAADEKQLNVRVRARTHELLAERVQRKGVTMQAYVSGLIESDLDPARESFVAGLVEDMTGLLDEFDGAFDPGRR
ncbi:hypothetical protein ACFYZ9_37735 [Streptomyces sp. NPDC001691]|uniref:hypothetical protein n=1 Tax=unclassified Streptomyces TaxID=2593676 RepID=UPI000DE8DB4D|nr:hypothetical protein [Streptomyces sp. SDr-06]RCH63989.1 hypothetical protein DT019_35335 [Streptomyces sp. SDr-06]